MDPHKLILTVDGVENSFHDWTLEYADRYFPDLENKVYRVPAVQFNNPGSRSKSQDVCGHPCRPLPKVDESHAKGDLATRVVCDALERLGYELGSLAIVANFQFENYLNRIVTPAGVTLHKPQDKTSRGDLDVLAVNLQSGPVVIEVKSVGFEIVDWSKDHDENVSRVRKQLIGEETRSDGNKDTDEDSDGEKEKEKEKGKDKALDQVQKAKDVFDYIMNDLDSKPQAIKVVALPFVPRAILNEIAADIAVHDKSDDVRFLCKDDLPDLNSETSTLKSEAARMSHSQPSKLRTWWDDNIAFKRQSVSVATLKAIMGRFCGLLSTVSVWSSTKCRVEVRTKGEAVSEAGKRFSDIVLTPRQMEILQERNDMAVGLRGPPGSGKTMLLALKGRQWVNQGHKVVVAVAQSLGGGVPSGFSLQKMVEDGAKKGTLSVDIVEVYGMSNKFDPKAFDDELAKLGDLPRAHIHFLMDEFAYRDIAPQILHHLVHEKRVSVWWAVLHSSDMTQVEGYTYFRLDRAMRSPPYVQRLLKVLEWNEEWHDTYTTTSEFEGLPTDGPPIKCVRHSRHTQPGLLPIECQECAEEISNFLINDLGVGVSLPAASSVSAFCEDVANIEATAVSGCPGQTSSAALDSETTTATFVEKKKTKKKAPRKKAAKSEAAVKYEDVLLLVQTPMSLCIKIADNLYGVRLSEYEKFWDSISNGPFIGTLQKRCLPVYVIPGGHPKDVAIPIPGKISMTSDGVAWGLERTVIVYVASDVMPDEQYQDPSVLDNPPESSTTDACSEDPSRPQPSNALCKDAEITEPFPWKAGIPSPACGGASKPASDTEEVRENIQATDPVTTMSHQASGESTQSKDLAGVCEEEGHTLLEMVSKLPKHHQQTLFVASSRTVSQLVLVLPTTWEK